MEGRPIIAAIGAVVALALQIVLAPNIAIMGVMPSFIIAYVVALAMLLPGLPSYLIAFCLGMFSDLLGYGPVGALPFILLIAVFSIDRAQATFGNGTLFVACIILVVFVLLVHFLHAAFMVAITSTYTVAEAFQLVAIPQGFYDCVIALLIYLAMRRVFVPSQSFSVGSGISNIRLR